MPVLFKNAIKTNIALLNSDSNQHFHSLKQHICVTKTIIHTYNNYLFLTWNWMPFQSFYRVELRQDPSHPPVYPLTTCIPLSSHHHSPIVYSSRNTKKNVTFNYSFTGCVQQFYCCILFLDVDIWSKLMIKKTYNEHTFCASCL